jgi:TonB dependent receptor/Carboxypeptidase regulatory-like domain
MTSHATGAVVLMLLTLPVSALAQERTSYAGMRLADALQAMRALGLRIVFSSKVVPFDMRVPAEPRGAAPREQLDELLAPHGLQVREGAGGTLQIVRVAPSSKRPAPKPHGTIEGRVVDATSGASLARVLVRVEGTRVEVLTDASGQFLLTRIPPGTRQLLASAPGFVPARVGAAVAPGERESVMVRLSPEPRVHSEFISVTGPSPHRTDRGVAAEMSLEGNEIARLHGNPAGDPLRTVQSLPGVAAVDDFRSEFTARGSSPRHVNVVVDGISTPWLQHTSYGRGATGSVTMLTPLMVENATLRIGAYPQRHGDRLGPELNLTLRQGSRARVAVQGVVGGDQAAVVAEGPIAAVKPAGLARGSWLVSARQSFIEWPPTQSESSRTAFAFWDAAAKVVFDVRPAHQLAVTLLGGRSAVDHEDNLAPSELANGTHGLSVFSLSWRSAFKSNVVMRQQASIISERNQNLEQSGRERDLITTRDVAYRGELSRPLAGGLLEAGVQVQRISSVAGPGLADNGATGGSAWVRSGFAHYVWALAPSLTISPGLRVTSSTLVRGAGISPWVLGEWSFRPGWSVIGSAGVSRQLPDLRYALNAGSPDLRPERAVHVECGVEHQLTRAVRWRVTAYQRTESDLLRADIYPRLERGALVWPMDQPYVNALQGASRGVELLVIGRSARRLSGWASYAFGRTRQTDAERHQSYWADFDQRHTFNVSGVYGLSRSAYVGATLRAGSNFPVAGYFAPSNGGLVVGSVRNQVRLPPYVRLDVRAGRRLQHFGSRLSLFAELQNVLNRANIGPAVGSIDQVTGEAHGFTGPLLARRLSAGVGFAF